MTADHIAEKLWEYLDGQGYTNVKLNAMSWRREKLTPSETRDMLIYDAMLMIREQQRDIEELHLK